MKRELQIKGYPESRIEVVEAVGARGDDPVFLVKYRWFRTSHWRAGIFKGQGLGVLINEVGDTYCVTEIDPYADLEIDDFVFVKNEGGNKWLPRHFAGVDFEGKPLVWANGTTSWTSIHRLPVSCEELREPTEEELEQWKSARKE